MNTNRIIKFRAWDDIDKKMYSAIDIFNANNGIWYEDNTDGTLNINLIIDSYGVRRKLEMMQFTGLLDSKGKEIYESDIIGDEKLPDGIVKDTEYPYDWWERGIAKYYPEYARFGLEFYSPHGGEGYTGQEQHISDYIAGENSWFIIGNIYENPELLR